MTRKTRNRGIAPQGRVSDGCFRALWVPLLTPGRLRVAILSDGNPVFHPTKIDQP